MNIVVLSGSPKGKHSISLQTILYLQKYFENDYFEILHVGQQIKQYERDMGVAIKKLLDADMVVFCYPVYTFVVPYQLHKFIELLKEQKIDLSGKFAAQITTSKHFYDVTAHKFIENNCLDLNMKYIHGLSADRADLLNAQGQKDAIKFWEYVHFCYKSDIYVSTNKLLGSLNKLLGKKPYIPIYSSTAKSSTYDTVVVTNCEDNDENLNNMILDFQNVYPYNTRVINIREYPFAGGCRGCFHCEISGKCMYKEGFDVFLREEIQSADAIVYAFTIRDHSMGASFKLYDDRQFCNGHRTVTMGMPVGYIISGSYSLEENLRLIIEGRCEVGRNFLCGVASDEENTASSIKMLSSKLDYALQKKLLLPQNFLGVGGLKIFRDLIYVMRGLMKQDHKFYKKHGMYDFPQKEISIILKMKLVGMLLSMPFAFKNISKRISDAMIKPYKKVIDKN